MLIYTLPVEARPRVEGLYVCRGHGVLLKQQLLLLLRVILVEAPIPNVVHLIPCGVCQFGGQLFMFGRLTGRCPQGVSTMLRGSGDSHLILTLYLSLV